MLCSSSGVVITKIINSTNARSSSGVILMSLNVTSELRCENRRMLLEQTRQFHPFHHDNAIKRACRKDQEQYLLHRRHARAGVENARVHFLEKTLMQRAAALRATGVEPFRVRAAFLAFNVEMT